MATYLIINLIVVAVLLPGLWSQRRKPSRPWWAALALLVVLTAVFDNIIIGLGIVGYNPAKILGLHIGVAPVEDFFYAIAAMVIVPALWGRDNTDE